MLDLAGSATTRDWAGKLFMPTVRTGVKLVHVLLRARARTSTEL